MKRSISILLVVLIFGILLTGCGNNEKVETPVLKEPAEQVIILPTDDEVTIYTKTTFNELHKYKPNNIVMQNMSQTMYQNSDFEELADYMDAIIVKDTRGEIYNETGMDYLCIYTGDKNYIYTYNNELIDIEEEVDNFSDGIYSNYFHIIDWILEDSTRFEYTKNVNEDMTISHSMKTFDVEYIKEKYYETFGNFEFLEFLDGYYEFVFSYDADDRLVQIDWFGTDNEEVHTIEVATIFSTNIAEGYALFGEGVENIWDIVPQ